MPTMSSPQYMMECHHQFNLLDGASHSQPSPTSLSSLLPYLSKQPAVSSDMLHIADLHFPTQQSIPVFSCPGPTMRHKIETRYSINPRIIALLQRNS